MIRKFMMRILKWIFASKNKINDEEEIMRKRHEEFEKLKKLQEKKRELDRLKSLGSE
ncbi:MAG TPA: hypothetical protein VJC06_00525 [Candidatus Paceibacterota bacterium]